MINFCVFPHSHSDNHSIYMFVTAHSFSYFIIRFLKSKKGSFTKTFQITYFNSHCFLCSITTKYYFSLRIYFFSSNFKKWIAHDPPMHLCFTLDSHLKMNIF